MSNGLFAGVDIGGTKTAVVLSSHPPATLARRVFATKPEEGPELAIAGIITSLRELLAAQHFRLEAIGVSCGGPLDAARGLIQQPPNLSTWKDVPITTILAKEFGVKCHLDNDANAGALAERSYGTGKGAQNLVFLTMGTGLGAGLILNGQLYRGVTDDAGEIGHVRLTRTGPVGYHKPGSVEGWASGGGIAKLARIMTDRAVARGQQTTLTTAVSPLTAREIAAAAEGGDALARKILHMAGRKLGEAMAILIDLLNPECIIVGGLALRLGETVLGPARESIAREALGRGARACRIVPAELGERIGDVAAICVAMEGEKSAGQVLPNNKVYSSDASI